MRRYDLVKVATRQLVELTCSVCGRDLMSDEMERQEAVCFSRVGGYASVFGDGAEVTIDICQHCFKERLGEYCTVI